MRLLVDIDSGEVELAAAGEGRRRRELLERRRQDFAGTAPLGKEVDQERAAIRVCLR